MSASTTFPSFKVEPRQTAAARWAKYIDRFDVYLMAENITADERKEAKLLYIAGDDIYDIYYNKFRNANTAAGTKYDTLKTNITNYFQPRRNLESEIYTFRQASQNKGENIEQFYARLQELSRYCEFHSVDREIKSQIIQKCANPKVRLHALQHPDESLDEVLTYARVQEDIALQAAQMCASTGENNAKTDSVNRVAQAQKPRQGKSGKPAQNKSSTPKSVPAQAQKSRHCFRCGGEWPHPQSQKCPALGKKCRKCGRENHLAKVCRDGQAPMTKSTEASKTTNFISEPQKPPEYTGTLFTLQGDRPYKYSLQVNGTMLSMEIDTGASASLISEVTYKEHFNDCQLQGTDIRLNTYTGELVPPLGTFTVEVCHQDARVNVPLLVVPGSGPTLLGRNWLSKIKLDWHQVFKVEATDNVNVQYPAKFPKLFSDTPGHLEGFQAKINIDPSATPVFLRSRSVPFALKPKIEEEIHRLHKEGIISPTSYSEWATPIVPVVKQSGAIRLCGDYKVTLNKVAKTDIYPIPLLDELYAKLTGGALFSKLDLSHAYEHVNLDEQSQALTTINTHLGLFKYLKLPYGVSCAPAIFQKVMESVTQGIDMTAVYLDDILVSGKTPQEHDSNLEKVMNRLQDAGLRLKETKCEFAKKSLTFLGHTINSEGIQPVEEKVEAVLKAPAPTNVQELRSYLGLLNHYHRFLPNASTLLAPLHELLRKNTPWKWTQRQEDAFSKSKSTLQSSQLLVHYDPGLPLILTTDASPYGLGAVLSHRMPDGSERPVSFASRTLAPAERNYAQVEREGLAVTFGVSHFHRYLYGRQFTIVTDHKPLLGLIGEHRAISSNASARIQRWSLLLSAYDYKLTYRSGSDVANADAFSRLPNPAYPADIPVPHEIVMTMSQMDCTPLSSKKIAQLTARDPILSLVMRYSLEGWPQSSDNDENLKPYIRRRSELTVQQNCVMWGNRVVIPTAGRKTILTELHTAHPGVVRMKNLSRSFVWWPNFDKDIEDTVRSCTDCQVHMRLPTHTPIHPWEFPNKPWQRVHIDFAGPVDGKMLFLIIDAYSKFPFVHVMNSTTASRTIDCLRETCALEGIPEIIVSDNGPQFVSAEFAEWCKENGIHHIRSSAYHPATNGLVEKLVQTVKLGLKKQSAGDLETRLHRMLFTYRTTPHSTTETSPAELLHGRKLRTRLSQVLPNLENNVANKQSKMQFQRKPAKGGMLYVGDPVWTFNFSGLPKWLPGVIEEQLGPTTYIVRLNDGRNLKRHQDHVRIRDPSATVTGEPPVSEVDQSSALAPPSMFVPPPLAPVVDKSQQPELSPSHVSLPAATSAPNMHDDSTDTPSSAPEQTAAVRRSGRITKPVVKLDL
jgi:hypothetical protein